MDNPVSDPDLRNFSANVADQESRLWVISKKKVQQKEMYLNNYQFNLMFNRP